MSLSLILKSNVNKNFKCMGFLMYCTVKYFLSDFLFVSPAILSTFWELLTLCNFEI